MNYIVVRGSDGRLVSFGPDDGNYSSVVPAGCTSSIVIGQPPDDPPTPAQIAAAAQAITNINDAQAAKIDALVIAVMGLSPSQIDTMVDNRFPTLTASQRDYLKGLGKVVCVLARRL